VAPAGPLGQIGYAGRRIDSPELNEVVAQTRRLRRSACARSHDACAWAVTSTSRRAFTADHTRRRAGPGR